MRTGDKGRGRDGEPLPNFEPGSDVTAKVTVLAEGTQGHLTGVAIDRFGLAGENPQVWALGVKEVWKVARSRSTASSTRWGGRSAASASTASSAAPSSTRWATTWSRSGMVVGLDYRGRRALGPRPAPGAEDAQARPRILEGGERIGWGAKTIPEGGFLAFPQRFHAPGLLICGDGAGLVNVPALKGIHYAIESGRLAAEAAFAALQPGRDALDAGALASYDDALRETYVWKDLERVRNMRPAFAHGILIGGAIAGAATASLGKLPAEGHADRARRRADADPHEPLDLVPGPRRQAHLRQALVGLPLGEQDAGRRAQPHPGRERTCPRRSPILWERMCPAQVYEARGRRRRGDAVELRPVRRDHRERRAPDAARGRLRARVQADLSLAEPTGLGQKRDHAGDEHQPGRPDGTAVAPDQLHVGKPQGDGDCQRDHKRAEERTRRIGRALFTVLCRRERPENEEEGSCEVAAPTPMVALALRSWLYMCRVHRDRNTLNAL